MTAPTPPAGLVTIPADIPIGTYTLRAVGRPDSEGRFHWALRGAGTMGVVRTFTYARRADVLSIATDWLRAEGIATQPPARREPVFVPKEIPMPPLELNPNAGPGDCRIAGCAFPVDSRGLCKHHYGRCRRAGTLDTFGLPPSPIEERGRLAGLKSKAARLARESAPVVPPRSAAGLLVAGEAMVPPDAEIRAAVVGVEAVLRGEPAVGPLAVQVAEAIRVAGAAGTTAGRAHLHQDLAAIVTSSGVRLEGAEDLEPVEAVRRLVEMLLAERPKEPTTPAEILAEMDRNGRRLEVLQVRIRVLRRREAIATERAQIEVELAGANARLRELAAEEAAL